MQFTLVQLGAILGFAVTARSHFVLLAPTSLGFDDAVEDVSPCGSFDPTDRSTGVTEWPIGGQSISVITTHLSVKWTIRAALLSDMTNFVSLVPVIDQKGVGSVCFSNIPGKADWAGKDAVMQIYQDGVDGILYQCAAIKFTEGAAAPISGDCSNDTGVTWSFESVPTVTSTSTTQPTPTSTAETTTSTSLPTTTSLVSSASTTSAGSSPSSSVKTASTTTSGASGTTTSTSLVETTTKSGTGSSYATTVSGSTTTKASNSSAAATTTSPPRYTGAADSVQGRSSAFLLGGFALFAWLL